MKTSDVMSKHVDFVSRDTSIRDVSRIIFGRGINGVPVCKNRKVVGFITERDILAKFYPTMEEYVNDPVHSSDFEGMEKKVSEILDLKAESIMSKNPVIVTSNTPLLKAQSLMFVKKIGRLPVVDDKANLIGIVSKGDIFRSVIGQDLPLQGEEGFYDWSAKLYDTMIDWEARLSQEIPDIEFLFKKEKVNKVLDIASSTGEHSIVLAKKGFEIFGIESSGLMHKIAQSKKNRSSKEIQSRLNLLEGNYNEMLGKINGPIDAAIFMGNALPHVLRTDKNILKHVIDILREKHAVMVFQIVNFNKALQGQHGLRDFTIREVADSYYKAHAFLGFYTKKDRNTLVYTRAVFSSIGDKKWSFTVVNSTLIEEITKDKLEKALRDLGFLHISFYGSSFYGPLFKEPFKDLGSDWLNVVAKR